MKLGADFGHCWLLQVMHNDFNWQAHVHDARHTDRTFSSPHVIQSPLLVSPHLICLASLLLTLLVVSQAEIGEGSCQRIFAGDDTQGGEREEYAQDAQDDVLFYYKTSPV